MKKLLLLTLAVFAFSAQAGDSAKSAIDAATAENKKAKKVGFEWRDTGKFLKKASKLAKAGKDKKAIALANKAKKQAVLAQQQAQDQANAGPRF